MSGLDRSWGVLLANGVLVFVGVSVKVSVEVGVGVVYDAVEGKVEVGVAVER
jgi:hypothetical protein